MLWILLNQLEMRAEEMVHSRMQVRWISLTCQPNIYNHAVIDDMFPEKKSKLEW